MQFLQPSYESVTFCNRGEPATQRASTGSGMQAASRLVACGCVKLHDRGCCFAVLCDLAGDISTDSAARRVGVFRNAVTVDHKCSIQVAWNAY